VEKVARVTFFIIAAYVYFWLYLLVLTAAGIAVTLALVLKTSMPWGWPCIGRDYWV